MKRISGRSVNGAPESVVTGSASAAASETAPRIPIQATSATLRWLSWVPRSRMSQVSVKTQPIRTTITAALASRP